MRTRLTLAPGQNGTKKLVEKYGSRLVCVRFRYDEQRQRRYKTIELIVEDTPWVPPGAIHYVRIAFSENDLREKIKSAGGVWDPTRKLWKLTREAILRLNLQSRIVPIID